MEIEVIDMNAATQPTEAEILWEVELEEDRDNTAARDRARLERRRGRDARHLRLRGTDGDR